MTKAGILCSFGLLAQLFLCFSSAGQQLEGTVTAVARDRYIIVDSAGVTHSVLVSGRVDYEPLGWRPSVDDMVSLTYSGIHRRGQIIKRAVRVVLLSRSPAGVPKTTGTPAPKGVEEESVPVKVTGGSGRDHIGPPPAGDAPGVGAIRVEGGGGRDDIAPGR